MRAIELAVTLLMAGAPPPASVRGWHGVTPGVSTRADVVARFGTPSTQGKLGGRAALVYKGDEAVEGTRQAQFLTRDDGVVVEVVVFPGTQLDRESVEGTYGRPARKAFTEDFRPVWSYPPAGITVFFNKDGFVEAITFKASQPAAAGGTSGATPRVSPAEGAPRAPAGEPAR